MLDLTPILRKTWLVSLACLLLSGCATSVKMSDGVGGRIGSGSNIAFFDFETEHYLQKTGSGLTFLHLEKSSRLR